MAQQARFGVDPDNPNDVQIVVVATRDTEAAPMRQSFLFDPYAHSLQQVHAPIQWPKGGFGASSYSKPARDAQRAHFADEFDEERRWEEKHGKKRKRKRGGMGIQRARMAMA